MNILVLHQMGRPSGYRKAVVELETCLPTYAPQHDYIVHDAALPLPDYVREIDFHGVVLGPTFLCNRYHPEALERVQRDYGFIRDLPAFKIALPQDDYDCSAVLDGWMTDWKVDLLHTVCPAHWDVLYPAFSRAGRIELGYTGYIGEDLLRRAEQVSTGPRPIDVGYRARKLPPNYGRLGDLKGTIGEQFSDWVADAGLSLDISTRPEDAFPGAAWYEFIARCRFMLGTSSGSSLLDPVGDIRRCVAQQLDDEPSAGFETVEARCFPGEDMRWQFTALSPRNIECALLGTAQLLTPGSYSDILKPGVDYIELDPDGRNVDEVLDAIRDPAMTARVVRACREAVLGCDALRFEHHVARLLGAIEQGASGIQAGRRSVRLIRAYRLYLLALSDSFRRLGVYRRLTRDQRWDDMRGYPATELHYSRLRRIARYAAVLSKPASYVTPWI